MGPESTIEINIREKLISAGLAIPLEMKYSDALNVSYSEELSTESIQICPDDYKILRTDNNNFESVLDDIKDEVSIHPQLISDSHVADNSNLDEDLKPDVANFPNDTLVFIRTDQMGPNKEWERCDKFSWLSQNVTRSNFQAVGAF